MATPPANTVVPFPSPQSGRIHLRILSPGQGVAETIDIRDVPLEISVGQLKERIVLVSPSHPSATHQRLIFAGRLLSNDNAKLSEALDPACRNSESLTIHMIARDGSGGTRSQPITRTATPGQAGQGVSQTGSTPGGQEQQIPQTRAPVPAQQVPFGPQPPQAPQQVPGIPQFPGFTGFPGLPGNPFPFGVPPGAQIHVQQGIHQPQGSQAAQPQMGAPGQGPHQPQLGQLQDQHQQMMAAMQDMVRQQHGAFHRAAHEAAQQQHAQGDNGQTGQQPTRQTPATHDVAMTSAHDANEATPGRQDRQPPTNQTATTEGPTTSTPVQAPQNMPNERQQQQGANTQTQNQPLPNPQAGGPGQRGPQLAQNHGIQQFHAHFRVPTIQARPPQIPRAQLNGAGIPIINPISASQQLAMSFANIQAQAQLMAAPQTMFLLSSPSGPQALLYQNGQQYSAQLPRPVPASSAPLANQANGNVGGNAAPRAPQQAQPAQNGAAMDLPFPLVPQPAAGANNAVAPANAQAQPAAGVQAGEQDVLAPIQPLLQHFWLLFRVLLFAYFFIGTDDGYRRPLILLGIAVAFIAFRAVDGGGDFRRRVQSWWEGVVGIRPRPRDGQAPPAPGQPAAGAVPPAQDRAAQPGAAQVAAAPAQGQAEDAHLGPLRRRIRPLERAAALFVASLWPGVGENTIRARREREADERRAREEREREEQARLAAGPAEGRDGEGNAEGYPRSVPISVEGQEGATGVEAVDSIAELERRRRREEEGEQGGGGQ
ncbi:hypothetical protein BDZ85DRAFT_270556 [Elsinoe ampelina]|uniref:Ubiquitin-like domain-containing protein n=1 Tax=Elsinoe ampelina TaxID=302913 RepID=A0A6A6FY35_9PEZI|nr:hypothetical protein BDZ85DRAFT_270556 [Elsinoe ampelina]